MIISVGYRVKSQQGTRFRQWATRILREHLTQGYTINQQRFEANARELEAARNRNNRLFDAKNQPVINDVGLAALALLVAESDPSRKETMIRLIMNMLSQSPSPKIYKMIINTSKALNKLLTEFAQKSREENFVFRGHADSSWLLQPKAFRMNEIEKSWENYPLSKKTIQQEWIEDKETFRMINGYLPSLIVTKDNYKNYP